MKKWFILTAVVVAVSMAVVAMAQPGPMGGREGRGGSGGGPGDGPGFGGGQGRNPGMLLQRVLNNDKLAEKVGLTAEQVAALKSALNDHQKQMIKLRADADLARLEVQRLLAEKNVDRAAVLKAVDAEGAAHTAVRKAAIEERLKVRDIVGEETLEKIRGAMADRFGKGGRQDGEGRRARGPRGEDDDEDRGRGPGEGKGQGKRPAWMQDEMPPPAE